MLDIHFRVTLQRAIISVCADEAIIVNHHYVAQSLFNEADKQCSMRLCAIKDRISLTIVFPRNNPPIEPSIYEIWMSTLRIVNRTNQGGE